MAAHHHGLIWRHTPSVGQFAETVAVASAVAEDISGRGHVGRHGVVRGCRGFGALHEGDVDGGVRGGRRALVEHRDIVEGPAVLFVEALHPRGVRRQEELPESIGQSRAGLNLTEVCSSGGKMMLTGHGALRRLALWDTAET